MADDLALQPVGVLVFIDQDVVEIRGHLLRQPRLAHHRLPVDQQVIVVEQPAALLALDVGAAQLRQVLLPAQAPAELLLERLAQALLRVDAPGVDRQAGVLARKALGLLAQLQFLAQVVEQIGRIAPVDDGVAGLEIEVAPVVAQQAVADRMKGAGPDQPLQHRLRLVAERVAERRAHDVVRAPAHLARGAAREGQQQDARRIHAVHGQPGGAMRDGLGLAGARPRHHQQRSAFTPLPSAIGWPKVTARRCGALRAESGSVDAISEYIRPATVGLYRERSYGERLPLHPYLVNHAHMNTSAAAQSANRLSGRVITVNVETVRLPNGHVTDLEIIHHPGGAAIVAVDAERACA